MVWVQNRATPAASATRRITFDQVHKVSGSAWLRRDSDRNSGPRTPPPAARHPARPEDPVLL